jgi:phage terminase large subunit-like protein
MTRGDRVIAFCLEYCKVPEGSKVGQPIELAQFQIDFIKAIYDNPAGTRRAIMGISRKNGKSALIACLLLASICGPEAQQNAQIVSGAMSRDQAALVFNLAVKMIQLDERLEAVTRIIPSGKKIIGLSKNTEYKALAADGTTAHGLSPILAILDEVGQIKGGMSPFVEAILTSQGAHDNPLQIFISTQASNDADFFSQMIDDAQRSEDPKTVCHLYSADADCDLLDEAQWAKANPALDLFRSRADLEEQLKQAERLPSMEASARNLLLNQRIALESVWLAPKPWKECSGAPDWSVFKEKGVTIGLDLSMRTDLTAAVIAAQDDDGVVHVYPYVFAPLTGIADRSQRDRAPYEEWARDGHLVAVPGSTVDYDWVAHYLRDALDDEGVEVTKVCFDRWRISVFRKACEDVGAFSFAEWIEVGQGYRDMSPRLEAFESLLLAGNLRHGAQPLLNMSAANAIAVADPAGSRKLDKSKASLRIDPLVAAVMAVFEVSESDSAGGGFDVGAMIA